ncbi:MAG TPA: archaemetzincin, partial [Sumerlaeia bacterium]|nr:archaemetzincin [Sumerlaeia bacterium]
PPDEETRRRAIGSLEGVPQVLRKALDPTHDFEPIPAPRSGDWLAVHPESGQTFDEYARSRPNRPDAARNKIYLQPLGAFPLSEADFLRQLERFASAYFGLAVQVLPSLDLGGHAIKTRRNPFTRNRQILTGDVLTLLKRKLPGDAYCILAITMEDLYPEPSWNFVFGQASPRDRVGVYSFARYDPEFYGQERGPNYHEILLRRSCRVLAHETGHMFGIAHCIHFKCVMNGSNHLAESDSRPLHLCPVDLRKLQHNVGFDVADRYARLRQFYADAGLAPEAQWIANRLGRILGQEKSREDPGTPVRTNGKDKR